jgi:hypothetical protein
VEERKVRRRKEARDDGRERRERKNWWRERKVEQ